MELLLTNDDGYGSPGLRALEAALEELEEVTVVAPTEDRSESGRTCSERVRIERRDRGVAVSGTPVDCVIVGLEELDLDPDLVIAGCNNGANIGSGIGRSGTVGAAVEATFAGQAAMAVSLYVPKPRWPLDPTVETYDFATRLARYLADRAPETGVFEDGGYLNVNVPLGADETTPIHVTRLSTEYAMSAGRDGESVTLRDVSWDRMADGGVDEPTGTDRWALLEGGVSISPLRIHDSASASDSFRAVIEEFDPSDR